MFDMTYQLNRIKLEELTGRYWPKIAKVDLEISEDENFDPSNFPDAFCPEVSAIIGLDGETIIKSHNFPIEIVEAVLDGDYEKIVKENGLHSRVSNLETKASGWKTFVAVWEHYQPSTLQFADIVINGVYRADLTVTTTYGDTHHINIADALFQSHANPQSLASDIEYSLQQNGLGGKWETA